MSRAWRASVPPGRYGSACGCDAVVRWSVADRFSHARCWGVRVIPTTQPRSSSFALLTRARVPELPSSSSRFLRHEFFNFQVTNLDLARELGSEMAFPSDFSRYPPELAAVSSGWPVECGQTIVGHVADLKQVCPRVRPCPTSCTEGGGGRVPLCALARPCVLVRWNMKWGESVLVRWKQWVVSTRCPDI